MAVRHVHVVFGDSLIGGAPSFISTASADYSRWTGKAIAPLPLDDTVDDVKILSARMPYNVTTTTFTAGVGTTTTNIKLITGGGPYNFTAADVGKWLVFVTVGGAASTGVARRVTAVNAVNDITINIAVTGLQNADTFELMDGANVVNSLSGLVAANCSVSPLRFYLNNTEPFYGTGTGETGLDYPNYIQNPMVSPAIHGSNNNATCIPELSWHLKAHTSGSVYMVVCGIGLATLSSYTVGTAGWTLSPAAPQVYSWSGDITQNDFSPASANGLLTALKAMITAFHDIAVAAGDTISVDSFFLHLGTNDSTNLKRSTLYKEAMRELRTHMRDWLAANSYTDRSPDKVPWIMSSIGGTAASLTYKSTINDAIAELAEDDPYSTYVDTSTSDFAYNGDGIHLSQVGAIAYGQALYDAWLSIRNYESDSSSPDETRAKLSDLRTRVRRRYERTANSNDASNTQVDGFINDALREIYNTLGDNPWFLRKTDLLTPSGTYPNTYEMPKSVRRPVRFEQVAYPGRQVPVRSLYTTDAGAVVVTLPEGVSGQLRVYHTMVPMDLEGDDDRCLVPYDYTELIVVLTCKRLAECSGNGSVASYYAAESERLWKYVKRNVQLHRRLEQNQITAGDSTEAFGYWATADEPWRF